MRLLGTDILVDFVQRYPDARSALSAFEAEVEQAGWANPSELKGRYPRASFVGGENVVFDIRGGNYRLHARVNYAFQIVIVVRLGTHSEYDRWTF
jgi:mRNA interferase HigB